MKVSREQAAANREKVVDAASSMFRKYGFDGIGVADIMKAAGLTHGGFYAQFDSKDHLAAEACERALQRSWDQWIDPASNEGLEAVVRRYLTATHRDDRGRGCLFAALGPDIGRQPKPVRRAVTEGFRRIVVRMQDLMTGRSEKRRRQQALAILSGIIGALILSRMVDDAELSDNILSAAVVTFARPATA
jgi:TetR/AcrR family transcriptional repressor of nem operon